MASPAQEGRARGARIIAPALRRCHGPKSVNVCSAMIRTSARWLPGDRRRSGLWGELPVSARLAYAALDQIQELARPDRLHQGLVRVGPAPRHLEQIAAHHDGPRAELRSRIGDHDAVAVGEPPVGY